MDDWVNWAEFAALNAPEIEAQGQRRADQEFDDERYINQKMLELDHQAVAAGPSNAGNLSNYSAFQDLMNRKSAARARAASEAANMTPWERDLRGEAPAGSTWDRVGGELGRAQSRWDAADGRRQSFDKYWAQEAIDRPKRHARELAQLDSDTQRALNRFRPGVFNGGLGEMGRGGSAGRQVTQADLDRWAKIDDAQRQTRDARLGTIDKEYYHSRGLPTPEEQRQRDPYKPPPFTPNPYPNPW